MALLPLYASAQGLQGPLVAPIESGSVRLREARNEQGQVFPAGMQIPIPEGWYVNNQGWANLSATLTIKEKEIARLNAINAELDAKLKEVAAKPGLTLKSVLILVGAGLAVGAGTALLLTR